MRKLYFTCSILFVFGTQWTIAQTAPRLSALSREWFQRGTTNEITLSGENLRDVTGLRVSGDAGVVVQVVPAKNKQPPVVVEASAGGISVAETTRASELLASVIVAPDAALNSRELRVITGTGASNPLIFHVSPLPEMVEARQGSDPQKVELPVGISGSISAAGEQDSYTFNATRDQEIIVDVLAFRNGSPLDSSVAVLNAAGKELARSEDAKGFDSFLRFKVPDDGQYLLQLRDFRYTGSPAHKYHLTLGALPCVDSAFPAGARRGQSVEVTLRGSNLAEINTISLHPQPNAPVGWQEIRVLTPRGLSMPFAFQVSDQPEFTETEPNDTAKEANVIRTPITINGRLQKAKDTDTYKFKVTRAQTLVCEVTAQRIGSPLDALLTLRDAAGQVLQQNDDAEGADARIEYAFQMDAEYTLSIRDLLARGGEDYVYRISIQPPKPSFSVRFAPDTPQIYCGGRTVVRCEVNRQAGFSGPVRIVGQDMPRGITAEPLLINPDEPTTGLLVLNAENNAVGGTFPIHLIASGVVEGKRLSRSAEPFSGETLVKEGLLTVLDSPPVFKLDLLTLSTSLEQEQSANLEVLVSRKDGFDGDIKIYAEGYSSGREVIGQGLEIPAITVKAGETRAALKLKAKLDADVGSRLMYLRGETTSDGQKIVQYSQAIPLAIRQVPFTLLNTMKRLSAAVLPAGVKSPAAEAEFAVRASRRGWFTDQINLTLEGLPDGVTATSTNLPSRVGEVSFKLVTTDKAVPKEYPITIVGSATIAGRTYQQRTEPLTLTVTKAQEVAEIK